MSVVESVLRQQKMKKKQKIVILGATGSIGDTSLREIKNWPDFFEVVGISSFQNESKLINIAKDFNVKNLSIEQGCNRNLSSDMHLFWGKDAATEMISKIDFDTVIVAIPGVASLNPTIAAIKRGKRIILASKEVMVIGGHLIRELCEKYGAEILPMDSEHNAIFQCIKGENKFVRNLWLTASGGCLRAKTLEEVQQVSAEEVLNHPKWSMGKKITVDSSSMANKGLEVIEAKYLFNIPADRIKVVIHPQCLIHSAVEFLDGSFLAHMAPVSMKYAARSCLFYPERCIAPETSLNLCDLTQITFDRPDLDKFPCLRLAFEAANRSHFFEIAFNAANEILALDQECRQLAKNYINREKYY